MFRNRKLKKVKLVLLDVDGVLTDGGVYYNEKGMEQKRFNVKDGSGIKMAVHAGIRFAVITGRRSRIVDIRARELDIHKVYQGALKKHLLLERIMKDFRVSREETAFIADDIIDLELFRRVGFRVAVKDAVKEIRQMADLVTKQKGGYGAVRDFIEYLLKSKKLWKTARERYL
ncbi:MAG: HAD hydrolase family protein [bacterium]|nr:HAD hydrolase family protein [bacterium]